MYVLEAEAKQRWCPMARTLGYESDVTRVGGEPQLVAASINREPGEYDKQGNETVVTYGRHRCLGSACMWWRWHSAAEHVKAGVDIKGIERPRIIGYCGAAGAP